MPTSTLQPALELAWMVARQGLVLEPPVEPPRLLRPLLTFTRLPTRALETVRRVLQADEEFRARVLAEAEEGELERPSWLFLARPPGWEGELSRAGRELTLADEVAREEREERSARRQLRGAQEAARRAEDARREAVQALSDLRARGARTAEELAAERAARLRAEEEVAALRSSVASLESQVAEQEKGLRDRGRQGTGATAAPVAEADGGGGAARGGADGGGGAARGGAAGGGAGSGISEEAAAQVLAATRAAAAAVIDLSSELQRIASVLNVGAGAGGSGGRAADEGTRGEITAFEPPPPPASGAAPAKLRRPEGATAGRQPIRLPPGLLEDAPESAEHLVRTNGVVLVVDGYNVSHACWPTLAIAEQRRRLVDALGELVARTGADVEVVFDGGEHGEPAPPGTTRQPVRIRFSPPGTEADDVILEMVGRYPPHRPIVVATSDRRVRDGARRGGANVISAGQLLKVLHRDRGW